MISLLAIGLHYVPEVTGNAPYTTRLLTGLKHETGRIGMITGYPHYPEWVVREGYSGWTMREVVDGVPVLRVRHPVPSLPSSLSRLGMEVVFGLRAIAARWGRPDVVLAVSPALFATAFVVVRARLAHVPVGVWVQDLYSSGLAETQGGSSFTVRVMRRVEGWVLRSATGVTVIHEMFRRYVVDELRVPADRVRVIRNWTHVQMVSEVDRTAVRDRFGWRADEIVALHAGNMGMKQNLENVVDAAREAAKIGSRVHFVLLGNGNQRAGLERYGAGVGNLTFLDSLPDEEFTAALRSADVLLVNELPGVKEMSVPSKLTSYFAAGVPVVAATEADSATAEEVRASGAGVVTPSGDPAGLLHAVERVAADRAAAAEMAATGPQYVTSVLSENVAIDSFAEWLEELAGIR